MFRVHLFQERETVPEWGTVLVNGEKATLQFARVSAVPYNVVWPGHQRSTDDTEIAPFLSFESNGPAEVRVRSERIRPQSELIVRPRSRNVRVAAKNGEATFVLPGPGAYTFEIDGFHKALHLFCGPERDFAAEEEKSGRTVLRYGPGVHETGNVEIPSHTSVVLDPGAVVYGSFTAIGAEDVRLCGYGIVDGSGEVRTDETCPIPYSFCGSGRQYDLTNEDNLRRHIEEDHVLNGCVRFYNCRDFSVEGPILRDSSVFALIPANCEDFVIENVKTIGMWRFNSDGIDLFNCRNAVIRNCFLRNFDDCVVLKGIRGWDTKNMENILVEGCVVWCDWGSALEVGAETNADVYENILFRDCDVIHASSVCMRVHHNNRADIRNVAYENIRAEYTKDHLPTKMIQPGRPYDGKPNEKQPKLFVLIITPTVRYSDLPISGTIENVRFSDIRVYKDKEVAVPESMIRSKDEEHRIRNVTVGRITVNGETAADYRAHVQIDPLTENVAFTEE